MDLRKLKTLIELVSESSITELEVTEDGSQVRIVRASESVPVQTAYVSSLTQPMATPVQVNKVTEAPSVDLPSKASAGTTVTSPMVGTFYSASSPGAAPFVKVGATVQPGDTLCIIEAMKILNEIEAEQVGVVTQVLVENGEPVEYGQPLFIIE